MDQSRIQALIEELDGLAPRDGAAVRIHEDLDRGRGRPDDQRVLEVEGNPAGYLRLGLMFLQAAFAPVGGPKLDGDEICVDIPDVVDDQSAFQFADFRRWDNPPAQPRQETSTWGDVAMTSGCLGVVGIVLVLVLIGLFQVVKSLFPLTH